jgi:hypothetical protein
LEQTYERLCEVTTRKGGYLDKQGISLAIDAMTSIHTTLLAELDMAVACYEECFLTPTNGSTSQLPTEAHPTWYRASKGSNMVSYCMETKQW